MKIKTNIRAGQGGTTTSVDTSTTSSTNSGGVNAGGVNSNKPNNTVVSVVYIPATSRCVGL